LTFLLDPVAYPAAEVVAIYHERGDIELGYDEIKIHMLQREETIRSRLPPECARRSGASLSPTT